MPAQTKSNNLGDLRFSGKIFSSVKISIAQHTVKLLAGITFLHCLKLLSKRSTSVLANEILALRAVPYEKSAQTRHHPCG